MKQNAVSPKGAIGATSSCLRPLRLWRPDPHDTEQNIDAGTRLLERNC